MKRLLLIVALLSVAIVALEPFGLVMPSNAQMSAAGILLAILVFSIGLLWQEKPADEREEKLFSDRARLAYFAGLIVGSVGIVYEAINHNVNWWLVAVIGTMLLIKLIPKK